MRIFSRTLWAATALLTAATLAACGSDKNTGPDTPFAPQNVSAVAQGTNSVVVTWTQVSNASAYRVERADAGSATFAQLGSDLTSTAYIDNQVTAGTQYQYRVRAVNGSKVSNPSNVASVTTQAGGPKTATIFGVTTNRTLSKDTVYTLSGYVKVSNGATLTIQPGTKIVGDVNVAGSSLWILRGAKIDAQGTAQEPIVFTSAKPVGQRKPGDWGGIIIVGRGRINRTAGPIFTEGPTGAAEDYSGGTDNNDNSGTLRYVRIEFAGYDVSNGQGQELNSLSSYAVGRGTKYEYIESFAGLDDSFEWFGGAVDGRYLVSYESGDDHFDWTEGYSGRNQFLIALQTQVIQPVPGTGTVSSDPRGFEGDGCETTKSGCTFANAPFSMPVFANFTVVGPGTGVFSVADGNGAVIRRGSGGTFVNGIIARWPAFGISLRDQESENLRQADSVTFRNVILAENGNNFEPAGTNFGANLNSAQYNFTSLAAAGSLTGLITSVTPASLDWTPKAGSAAATGGMASFANSKIAPRGVSLWNSAGIDIVPTAYIGAADPAGGKWWQGWTAYYACTAQGC